MNAVAPVRGNVLVMAGGTGGHVFPALTLAHELRARGYGVHWLGAEHGMETRIVPKHDIPLFALRIGAVRGGGLARKLSAPWKILRAVLAARRVLRDTHADLAVGFGGYASGPGGIAAVVQGIPLVLHEQNAVPGMTNRMLARFSGRVLQAFDSAFGAGATTVGNPVREEIAGLEDPQARYARHEGPLRVLVTGGSQGARVFNTCLPAQLARLAGDAGVLVRHQAGRDRREEAEAAYDAVGLRAQVDEFIDDMAAAYDWADLVICRAGALTVSEVAAAGVAAVFVPLPGAVDDHQTLNARWLAEGEAALLLPQAALEKEKLADALAPVFHRDALAAMAARARQRAMPDSGRRTADICEEMMHE